MIDNTTTTLVIAMPATTHPPDDNCALIGGIVGGVVALLIVIGVIAFIVMRNRKAKDNQQNTNDGHSLSPPAAHQPSNSNYNRHGRNDILSPSNYSESAIVQSPPQIHYDSLIPGEI
jgi:flagellar biosynthesis/type III secretory pathway M-ring protein FliF/YscJ